MSDHDANEIEVDGVTPTEEFVASVGNRVREARRQKGISRRVLSENSNVSQRFLAQLETGGGNVSIAVLKRIAEALDLSIEWLISGQKLVSSEAFHLARQTEAATPEQRDQIRRILASGPAHVYKPKRICLIGLRGAGKSTLGAMLGEAIGLPFVELNQRIESEAGMAVNEVMALYGPEGYRRLEKQALEQLVVETDAVILEAAGGIVSEPETYQYLLRHFHTIWVKASPKEHMERVRKQGDERPMAGNAKAMDDLRSILMSREALYAQAEVMINTSGKTSEQSLGELVAATRAMAK